MSIVNVFINEQKNERIKSNSCAAWYTLVLILTLLVGKNMPQVIPWEIPQSIPYKTFSKAFFEEFAEAFPIAFSQVFPKVFHFRVLLYLINVF